MTAFSRQKDSHGTLATKLASLSPEKRALLALRLKNSNISRPSKNIIQRKGRCVAPLSHTQQMLWFLDQFEPGSPEYITFEARRLSGHLDLPALEQSFQFIVDKHEILRVKIKTVNGQPTQVFDAETIVMPEFADLKHLPLIDREEECQKRLVAEAGKAFNLSEAPLIRFLVFSLSEEEHVLLLVIHHVISDGWSRAIFFNELYAAYNAIVAGQSWPVKELPIQYSDYAFWQQDLTQGEEEKRLLDYWSGQLANVAPVLDLPTDKLRPAVQGWKGDVEYFSLPLTLTEKIKKISQENGATLFMTLLSVFNVLLYRYTGQSDIVLGAPVANRSQTELEMLIGYFSNTLLLRADLSGNPDFLTLLARVKEVALAAYSHQNLPFERLIEELQPERDISRNPLFQVMFVLQNIPGSSLKPAGLDVDPVTLHNGTSKFDLTFSIKEQAGELRGEVEYSTGLFERATIVRLIGHYQVLLAGIIADPDRRIADLPLLTDIEQQQQVKWNTTALDSPQNQCLHQLFEAQVLRTPDNTAVTCGGQSLSYLELNARANQLAHVLQERGIGPEKLVGLYLERSLEMVIALLAILKAGGAYLPLDISYPSARIALILDDAQISLVLTLDAQQAGLAETGVDTICLDRAQQTITSHSDSNPGHQGNPQDLAYVIYTSGSTGRPKGVQVQHGNVVNFLTSMRQMPGLSEQDRFLAITTLCFDIAVLELYLPLITGAHVIVASRDAAMDGQKLRALMEAEAVTVMQATPGTWQILLAAGWRGSPPFKVLCGGEAFPKELASALLDRELNVWNMYGPTETTVWSSCYPVTDADAPLLIGRPIANTTFHVLDSNDNPVPIGIWGELYIGGAGVTRGYLNQPELTAGRYIPDPFSNTAGVRLYRTGDLVRYRDDGTIEYSGRLDYQVKVRGFRIELGEIEAVLSEDESIVECVVVVREFTPGDQRIIAYVVYESGVQRTITELRQFLRSRLPEYMLPSFYMELETIPLTSGGKIDRKALPDLSGSSAGVADQTPPETLNEKLIATIWCEALNVQDICVEDNFFDAGGHSLLSVRVIAEMEEKLGVRVTIMDMLTGTLQQIAASCKIGPAPETGEAQARQIKPESASSLFKKTKKSFARIFRGIRLP